MADLSPAAQAIWDAFNATAERVGTFEDYGDALAAALQAAADQVVPASQSTDRADGLLRQGDILWDDATASICRRQLLTLATELEAH